MLEALCPSVHTRTFYIWVVSADHFMLLFAIIRQQCSAQPLVSQNRCRQLTQSGRKFTLIDQRLVENERRLTGIDRHLTEINRYLTKIK